jgi:hypothetical protein
VLPYPAPLVRTSGALACAQGVPPPGRATGQKWPDPTLTVKLMGPSFGTATHTKTPYNSPTSLQNRRPHEKYSKNFVFEMTTPK